MDFLGRGILLDIEGTTSSITFVYDVMFPFIRRELDAYLSANWGTEPLTLACDAIARDAGHGSFTNWCGDQPRDQQQQIVRDEVIRLMDADIKATGLKSLQGLIWQAGFARGELISHLYDDVVPAIEAWREAGIDVRVYSSGSVAAQRLFFGHTEHGDLLHLFTDHYDTQFGGKRQGESYRRIAEAFQIDATKLLFVSDIMAELEAARQVGWQTALCVRLGNAEVTSDHGHATIYSLEEIAVARG